jgi:hypothetical protein
MFLTLFVTPIVIPVVAVILATAIYARVWPAPAEKPAAFLVALSVVGLVLAAVAAYWSLSLLADVGVSGQRSSQSTDVRTQILGRAMIAGLIAFGVQFAASHFVCAVGHR